MSPKRIVFLHGVGGSGAFLRPLGDQLDLDFDIHFPDGPQAFDMGPGGSGSRSRV